MGGVARLELKRAEEVGRRGGKFVAEGEDAETWGSVSLWRGCLRVSELETVLRFDVASGASPRRLLAEFKV